MEIIYDYFKDNFVNCVNVILTYIYKGLNIELTRTLSLSLVVQGLIDSNYFTAVGTGKFRVLPTYFIL